ncbi:DUF4350 domain-containing protein [Halohasta salina]|uniref:DUF4350 domain-containing protein n=1 Tax=Halohasta salina TaxID=2961621 RepID=UPI0020A4AF4A|nr:DUF4350 domain-containing protein [Halohasta salina]
MADDSLLTVFSPRVLLAGFIIAIALAIGAAAVTTSATLTAYNPSWDGTSEMRSTIATDSSTQPVVVDTAAYDRAEANDTLAFILAPRETYNTSEVNQLQAFLDRGGTILVAEDQRTETNQLLADLGVKARIDGEPLRDPRQYYRNPAAPVITDVSKNSTLGELDQFTLNRGTVLRSTDGTAIANTSDFAYIDQNDNEQLDRNEPLRSYPVLASEQVSNGRVLVLSDPSVFINQMVARGGNHAFLNQLIASNDYIMLDYSHSPGTTPAIELWLWTNRTAWAQAAIGALAGLAVVLWTHEPARREIYTRMNQARNRINRHPDTDPIHLNANERATFLQNKHPEWDSDRIQRIVESMDKANTQSSPTDQSPPDTNE